MAREFRFLELIALLVLGCVLANHAFALGGQGQQQGGQQGQQGDPFITFPVNGSSVTAGMETMTHAGIQCTQSGADEAIVWSATGLPNGLSINSSSGLIGGTIADDLAGEFNPIVITATETTSGDFHSVTVKMTVYANVVFTLSDGDSVGTATMGEAFSYQINFEGGYGVLSFSSSNLPAGLSLDPDTGELSADNDDLQTAGAFVFDVHVEDEWTTPGPSEDDVFGLVLQVAASALQITTGALTSGEVGMAYGPVTLVATGGIPSYTWTVTGLPAGLSIAGAVISGTPLAGEDGVHQIDILVEDSSNPAESYVSILPLTIYEPGTNALTINTTNLNTGEEEDPYSPVVLSASGGSAPYVWSVVGLPTGLSLDGDVISGEPLEGTAGTYSVNIVVTDSNGAQESIMLPLVIDEDQDQQSSGSSGGFGSTANLVGGAGGCALSGSPSTAWWMIIAVGVIGLAARFQRRSERVHS